MKNLNIDEIFSLSNQDYESYISKILKRNDAVYTIDTLDDELLKVVEMRPNDVARICQINAIVFAKNKNREINRFIIAYNFNTSMLAAIFGYQLKPGQPLISMG